MHRQIRTTVLVAGGVALLLALVACGNQEGTAQDARSSSSSPSTPSLSAVSPDPEESDGEPAPQASVDPDPAVVEGLDLAFDADALTMTLDVPALVATDRLLVLYRWQKRDGYVAVETTLVGDEPALNAVWTDYSSELSGKVKDVDAAWDLDAGTVTITLRERLNGDQATVAALGLGPKDRYPVEPPPGSVTEAVERR